MTDLASNAEKLGFVMLFPTTHQSNRWDCNSVQTLTYDGGMDSQGLALMAKCALQKYNGDPSKVFTVGGSSGAMITNVLAATYPGVFSAGSSYSGVPAGCWGSFTRLNAIYTRSHLH
jgi:acetylxylan esterase